MKIYLILFVFTVVFLFVNNLFGLNTSDPKKIIETKNEIEQELLQLDQLNHLIGTKQDLKSLNSEYSESVKAVGLNAEIGFEVAGSDGPPLGIPGFLWGFCLGLIGILVVLIAMSDNPDRKKHVTNAIYGCLAWTLLYLLIFGLKSNASVEHKKLDKLEKIEYA